MAPGGICNTGNLRGDTLAPAGTNNGNFLADVLDRAGGFNTVCGDSFDTAGSCNVVDEGRSTDGDICGDPLDPAGFRYTDVCGVSLDLSGCCDAEVCGTALAPTGI